MVAALLAASFGLSATTSASAACVPDGALFDDDFAYMDGSWGNPDDQFFVKDGALVIKGSRGQVNFSTRNEGANVCVDVTVTDAPDPLNSPAGVVFWWKDWDNYYYVLSWTDGGVEARRVLKGADSVIFTTGVEAVKLGLGQTNQIELRLKPKDATLFINGAEVKRFKGVQPKDGGAIGVIATSPKNKPATFVFDNLVVSAPAQ
ncbi:MAG: hypothetical protein AB7F74_20880 [Parvibaculaceae bacterium]